MSPNIRAYKSQITKMVNMNEMRVAKRPMDFFSYGLILNTLIVFIYYYTCVILCYVVKPSSEVGDLFVLASLLR